jgi:hypothetical protein
MESFRGLPDNLLYSIGSDDINYEKYDEQIIADLINKKLDEQQERIDSK